MPVGPCSLICTQNFNSREIKRRVEARGQAGRNVTDLATAWLHSGVHRARRVHNNPTRGVCVGGKQALSPQGEQVRATCAQAKGWSQPLLRRETCRNRGPCHPAVQPRGRSRLCPLHLPGGARCPVLWVQPTSCPTKGPS